MSALAKPLTLERYPATSHEALNDAISGCGCCDLCRGARNHVPGEGHPQAQLMLVGEGPGQQEDATGRPFVGAAGQLLERMLAAIGLTRQDVFIANIVKCRPPGNRIPTEEESLACLPFLLTQIEVIQPVVVICLGATSLRGLVGKDLRITQTRGNWFERDGVRYMPTYHPAALLRDPGKKPEAWEDFKRVRAALAEAARPSTSTQVYQVNLFERAIPGEE